MIMVEDHEEGGAGAAPKRNVKLSAEGDNKMDGATKPL